MTAEATAPAAILPHFGIEAATVAPLAGGLINRSWRADTTAGESFVVQALHPVFAPDVNETIAAVTVHLDRAGLVTPHLVETISGERSYQAEGVTWRVLTCIDGTPYQRVSEPAVARAAGTELGRFHRALLDFEMPHRTARAEVHDLARHRANLAVALADYREHPTHAQAVALATEIEELAASLAPLPRVRPRIVHGDPKITNLLFDSAGAALCWIDLDTVGPMALPLELGDAFRSWCNPSGEDDVQGTFALEHFAAALAAYAGVARDFITADERDAIVTATLTIYVELAARFCADIVNDSYFAWDPARFGSRAEHNAVRARSQLSAGRALATQRDAAERIVTEAFV